MTAYTSTANVFCYASETR